MQFDATFNLQVLQYFPDGRMGNFRYRSARLNLAINQPDPMFEEGRQVTTREITILIDGRRQNGSAVQAIPWGVVRSAPKEGDPERRATDNHCLYLFSVRLFPGKLPMQTGTARPNCPVGPGMRGAINAQRCERCQGQARTAEV